MLTIDDLNQQSFESEVSCKICGGLSRLHGVVDFFKNPTVTLPLAGVPFYYHSCESCGCVFTVAMDTWSKQDFLDHIYNSGYAAIDPGHISERPSHNAALVASFCRDRKSLAILDYGGGNGYMARRLSDMGYSNVESWDPMGADATKPEKGRMDLVTSFEVMEHTPTPFETFREAAALLKPDGVMLFSTVCIDREEDQSVQNWYVCPRNGHVTIHTTRSLQLLAQECGMKLLHLSGGLHFAYRTMPAWMSLELDMLRSEMEAGLKHRPIFLLASMSRVGISCASLIADRSQVVAAIDDERDVEVLHGVPRWSSARFLEQVSRYPGALILDFSCSSAGSAWVDRLCAQTHGVTRVDWVRYGVLMAQCSA